MSTNKKPSHAVKNASIISVINAIGFVSALLVDIAIASHFGLSRETDALFVAITVPQFIASILLVALSVVLVPIFTRVIIEEGESGLWSLSSNLVNLTFFSMGILGLAGSLSSPILIGVLGAGLDASTQALAVSLTRVVFLMVIPLGATEVLKATLNSLHSFAAPAATSLIRNITIFLMIIVSKNTQIHTVAAAYVVAVTLELFFLLPIVLTKGFKYRLVFQWREPRTAEVLRQVRHPLAGSIVGQSNILLERFLASFLPVGLVSALGYARRILRAVDNIFLGSVSTAFLPRLSAQFSRNRLSDFKHSLAVAVKLSAFVSFPITVGLVAMSAFVVSVLFERGAFDTSATQTTAVLLSIYIASIPSLAILQALRASYYAFGDTKTPFYIRVATAGLNAILDVVLFYVWGAVGLALALTLARTVVTLCVAWLSNRQIGSVSSELVFFLTKVLLASVLMGGLILALQEIRFIEHLSSWPRIGVVVEVAVLGISGGVLYLLLLLALRVKEAKQLVDIVRARFILPT